VADVGRTDRDDLDDGTSWSAGVSLSVPVYEGGLRGAQIRRSQARIQQVEADLQAQMDRVVAELYGAWSDLQNAVENVNVKRKFVAAAEERATIAGSLYATGNLPFDSWIIIEDDYALARKALLDAQAEALLAEARWLRAKGRTLEHEIK